MAEFFCHWPFFFTWFFALSRAINTQKTVQQIRVRFFTNYVFLSKEPYAFSGFSSSLTVSAVQVMTLLSPLISRSAMISSMSSFVSMSSSSDRSETVSYTHLDVYKRQACIASNRLFQCSKNRQAPRFPQCLPPLAAFQPYSLFSGVPPVFSCPARLLQPFFLRIQNPQHSVSSAP